MENILDSRRQADITFSASGCINIASRVAQVLRLKRGDAINVAVDDGEYYLYVQHRGPIDRYPAQCVPSNPRGRHFRANSKELCMAMIEACGAAGEKSVKCMAGEVRHLSNEVYVTIITKRHIV